MILNVSSRTDILAFYSSWFLNRYHEGFVMVRNPFNPKLVSRISFTNIDAIVFCTKNPLPFLKIQNEIKHPYIIQITLTPYQNDIEPNVPDKKKIIQAIQAISKKIGPEFVFVRYDPILINPKYSIEYHKKAFDKLCQVLDGYVKSIIVSFIDIYKNVLKHASSLNLTEITIDMQRELALSFVNSANKHKITVQTCGEENCLRECGFIKRDCVDETLAMFLTGKTKFKKWKARNNKSCNCVEMVDIGFYNTCKHYCKYCYANYDETKIQYHVSQHDPNSPLLIGCLKEDDIIKERNPE